MFSNRSTEKVFVHWSYLTDIDADKVEEYALVLKLMDKYPKVDFVMFTPQKMKFAEKALPSWNRINKVTYSSVVIS